MIDDADPLADADVGETVTVTTTEEIWLGQLESEHASGTDRFADRRVSDVEVVTDEYGEQYLAITVDSDVTKRLPHAWDTASAPRTDSERRKARLQRWGSRVATLLPLVVTGTVAIAVTNRLMSDLTGEVTINGEPLAYTPADLVPVAGLVLVVFMVVLAIPYLPGRVGGGR